MFFTREWLEVAPTTITGAEGERLEGEIGAFVRADWHKPVPKGTCVERRTTRRLLVLPVSRSPRPQVGPPGPIRTRAQRDALRTAVCLPYPYPICDGCATCAELAGMRSSR